MFKVPVFYRPEQVAPMQGGSPSAEKPKYVIESWLEKFNEQIDVRSFTPVTTVGLAVAHDLTYVQRVLNCQEENGFGTKDPQVAKSLPYTSGSFLAAAREALVSGVAASATSGFHHANYASGGGFCTFNGLMVAARTLYVEGLCTADKSIAILDFDAHYGNGTDDIIRHTSSGWLVQHFTRGMGEYGYRPFDEAAFLAEIPTTLACFIRNGAKVLLYQAGADPHVNDPLSGSGGLTTEGMRKRDEIVFRYCASHGLPVVWNLAGGYQTVPGAIGADHVRPVLDLHDNTMRECLAAFSA